MSVLVSPGLFLNALSEGFCQIDPRLVRQADKHPQHVSHLFRNVLLFALLKRLFAVLPRNDAGQLANLFRQQRHVSQFVEVAHAVSYCNAMLVSSLK